MLGSFGRRNLSKHFAKKVIAVEPTKFFLNEEAAKDNKFMN